MEELESKKKLLKTKLRGPETSRRWGLIQTIKSCYDVMIPRNKPIYYICGPTDHCGSDRGDLGKFFILFYYYQ